MHDSPHCRVLSDFLTDFQPSIVMLRGCARGTEYPVDQGRVTLGRGPGVDLAFDDPEMAREHASIEFSGGSFSIRALGSLPVQLNRAEVTEAEIKDGDRFSIGTHAFEFVIEPRSLRELK
ncbi:MAG: FHA domain-containing protein [bacterium]|nr:FHA domain-containing protein [bacterium]